MANDIKQIFNYVHKAQATTKQNQFWHYVQCN